MGQKTHPIGFRLGINKPWISMWYSDKDFPKFVAQDMNIRRYLTRRLPSAGIAKIEIARTSKDVHVTVFTSRPGIVIGKGGEEVDRLKNELKQLIGNEVKVNVTEVKRPELNATLIGQSIAQQIEKQVSYKRAIKKAIQSAIRMGAEGIRVRVGGRLGGSEIARSEGFHEGKVPLHTIKADVDFAVVEANTTYGKIGIKIWICTGTVGR